MELFERWESEVRGYSRAYPTVFKTASNARQVDEAGKSYLDFFGGAGVLNFGHNNPKMKEAIIDFIQSDGIPHSLDMATTTKREFMQAFVDTILKPRGMDYRMQFTGPTGTNAVEAALKLARRVTGRRRVIAFTNGFHGMTVGALAATANAYYRNAAGIPLHYVERLPFMHPLDGMDETYADPSAGYEPPAAILVEVIQAEGGVNVATKEWLQAIRQFAKDRGALFIIDDIQAGCGRTGSYFSFDGMDLDPDIITLAKGIGGFGTPLAMNLNKPEHDKHWSPGEHTGTFRGQGISFVAGKVAMDYFKDDSFMAEVRRKGEVMASRLQKMAQPGMEVRGRGMMQGIDTKDGTLAKKIVAECFRTGLLLGGCGSEGRVIKLIPPLTIEDADLNEGLDLLEKAMNAVLVPA
ncbi:MULTISPECIES: aspartate aminotransferase family protein [Henriciella]|jgi:diaminobutyrate-2-oxoglutarate transaminase|uniref:Aspartate aminotransferase family protein n=1 Tax=Henriciella pelagia TaxID=1977912 RepID=A0ABQ1J0G6_9PROT|nr:aspartate aminotransferase family protein [Henriciella pelagia]GGB55826.1 aspartate aminotransferase family protein [Henriciella pelagia]